MTSRCGSDTAASNTSRWQTIWTRCAPRDRLGWSTSAITPHSRRCAGISPKRRRAQNVTSTSASVPVVVGPPPQGFRCRSPSSERARRAERVPGADVGRRTVASGSSALRVVVVHPDLLGTYGDGGNGQVLAGRAVWRDIPVELVYALSDVPLPAGADVYCLGGGEDGPQVQSAERLRDGVLAAAVDAGAVVLAVCAGYQVIGRSFPGADGRPHPGVGLLDVVTVKGFGRRAVGELAAEPFRDSVGRALPRTRCCSRR